MVQSIAKIFGIGKDEEAKKFIDTLIKAGTVGAAAKSVVSGIKQLAKQIPVVKIVNAAVAGSIIAALGEVSVYAFEQIYLGNRSLDELDWLKNLVNKTLSEGVSEKLNDMVKALKESSDAKDAIKVVVDAFGTYEEELASADKLTVTR